MMSAVVRGLLAALACIVTLAAGASAPHQTRRDDLIGVWRLIRIEVHGPDGARRDPFYGAASEGLLIYARTGEFSVQIMSRPRPALDVPHTRPELPGGPQSAQKEAALDSYYAYYGTWSFDETTSIVTHHAQGALYPGEEHATYAQRVQVTGTRMVFTRASGEPAAQTIQTKIWERVSTHEGAGPRPGSVHGDGAGDLPDSR